MTQLQSDLRAVIALLDTPEKWTKGEFAKDVNGHVCPTRSKNAVRFCLTGACIAVTCANSRYKRLSENLRCKRLLREINKYLPKPMPEPYIIGTWNDAPERTFEDIHNLLNKALDGSNRMTSEKNIAYHVPAGWGDKA
jgi:hypothetical protein